MAKKMTYVHKTHNPLVSNKSHTHAGNEDAPPPGLGTCKFGQSNCSDTSGNRGGLGTVSQTQIDALAERMNRLKGTTATPKSVIPNQRYSRSNKKTILGSK